MKVECADADHNHYCDKRGHWNCLHKVAQRNNQNQQEDTSKKG
jgi:hypothetical protein